MRARLIRAEFVQKLAIYDPGSCRLDPVRIRTTVRIRTDPRAAHRRSLETDPYGWQSTIPKALFSHEQRGEFRGW